MQQGFLLTHIAGQHDAGFPFDFNILLDYMKPGFIFTNMMQGFLLTYIFCWTT